MVGGAEIALVLLYLVTDMFEVKTLHSARPDAQAHVFRIRNAARDLVFRTEIPVELAREGCRNIDQAPSPWPSRSIPLEGDLAVARLLQLLAMLGDELLHVGRDCFEPLDARPLPNVELGFGPLLFVSAFPPSCAGPPLPALRLL